MLKFSSINIRAHEDAQAYFAGLIEAFGPQRMMWGSDFPHTKGPYTELVELARNTFAFASTEVRDWLFAGTARKLYPALTGS